MNKKNEMIPTKYGSQDMGFIAQYRMNRLLQLEDRLWEDFLSSTCDMKT